MNEQPQQTASTRAVIDEIKIAAARLDELLDDIPRFGGDAACALAARVALEQVRSLAIQGVGA